MNSKVFHQNVVYNIVTIIKFTVDEICALGITQLLKLQLFSFALESSFQIQTSENSGELF